MFFSHPSQHHPYQQQHPYHHPYPPPHQGPYQWPQPPAHGYNPAPHQQQGGQQNPGAKLMSAFQTSDGKFDIQKAMTTMDQVVKTANQVSPLVKQVGSFFTTKT
ncbi:YppG family protein [Salipaludibacillus sp. LMS25]|jgi:hypothetical protein|uniref:YppG family protein n=1 Tax=Salipaludibacillus sp. LMS25 TaxID=2924031 RepID=UPI0020D16C51|nr:YppG family protein [Salipaludibacillus sp. LMS25]UTR15265.1 YppG family protein [Salipaludibacillus sp. LMS25]